ncbi:hypothetical protein EK21DRAFT_109812 [Setomelanomma holmii]|uniref:Uncharacterized protein n=1 Tax=Setomelanomma holmii TaxID=210430 RepID=A0A9P4HGT0_9PLEO|nr:hypothetical protein EK21DRAFT_109812 [Setomelanomma holmii]
METLHHQETALILILQTLGQLAKKERRVKLQDQEVVQTLTRAKKPSSSIFGLRGDDRSSVRFSYGSETVERMSAIFTFDMEVIASTAYRNAFTSLLKRNITDRQGGRVSAITLTKTDEFPDTQSPGDGGVGQAISNEHRIDSDIEHRMPPAQLLPPKPSLLIHSSDPSKTGIWTASTARQSRARHGFDA